MGYRYGHPSTSWSGIQQWLLGWTGKSKTKYVPNDLDINQRENFMRDIVIAYYLSKGKDVKKGKWRYKCHQLSMNIQKDFQDFMKFVKENYEEINKTK